MKSVSTTLAGAQIRVLRVLHIRIITAAHRNLKAVINFGRFRQDLHVRLKVFCFITLSGKKGGNGTSRYQPSYIEALNEKPWHSILGGRRMRWSNSIPWYLRNLSLYRIKT
ncbi:sigma 54-interacting transcriptional regulator [Desulforhopalus singaporensis]|uniref:sigma 54-interacting transcriptional regulator n=1 Tax=Desulforhopalus singaporensis TaxID=91360 RepID=UPI0038B3890D